MNLTDVIEGLVEERGLDREKVITIVSDGIAAAYNKKYPGVTFHVVFNRKTGNLDISSEKTVVQTVEDEDFEITLRKAKIIDTSAQVGSVIVAPFEEPIGRIEILAAKQIISGKIRELEQLAIYDDYKDKEGTVVTGTVNKRERAGYAVKIGDVLALLPHENCIPREPIKIGHPIRALLKEVHQISRGDYQLILDRASGEFIQHLLEVEIPEVYEGLVEIKKVVRNPGYKTKIIVASTRKEIDPVGTCVGVGGARIKPILREIGLEKIDLIQATDSIEKLVRYSLKPAEIDRVEISDGNKVTVWLDPDQRSFAIGKMGQNINLASRLVEMEIQLQDLAGSSQEITLDADEYDRLLSGNDTEVEKTAEAVDPSDKHDDSSQSGE